MTRLKALLLLPVFFVNTACDYHVTLAVKNSVSTPAPPLLNITANAKDKNGQQTGSIGLGTVNPGETSKKQTFTVKKGGSYVVQAALSSGANVYTSGVKTVAADLPDETVDITKLQPDSVDPNDVSAIQTTFGKLGADLGFNPVTVPSALGSLFGGLVWYVDGADSQTAETQLVMIISPSQLTGAVSVADFQYPQGPAASHDDNISTNASVKVSASVPLWGNLAGGFASNSLYKTHWSMVGFGNVTKTDTVSFQDKLLTLSQAQKDDICARLQTQKSHVMYVNEMYVVKSAILTYQKGNAVTSSASASGGSVIAGSAEYDFSSSQIEQTEIDDTVVNVEGPTFTKDTLSFCQAAPAVASVAVGVNTSAVQPVVHLSTATALIQNSAGQNLALEKPQLKSTSRSPQ